MNCADFRSVIQDLAREETPADAALNSAILHAESCLACDALLREAEKLTADLRLLAAQLKSEAASARVESALLDAIRQRHAPALRMRDGSGLYLQPGKKKVAGWLAVSAAGLAATVLGALLLTSHPDENSPQSPTAPATAPRESNRPLGPREVWADYAVQGETLEQAAAAYIPLSAGFDPSWLEGGAIVRVVLSRPALESLGVPVSAAGNGEIVADMVVSNDGTPEAIRFVDWQVSGIQ